MLRKNQRINHDNRTEFSENIYPNFKNKLDDISSDLSCGGGYEVPI